METTSQKNQKEATVLEIDVGGRIFTTTRSTLCSDPDSMLAKMFDPDSPFKPLGTDSVGRPFADRDGDNFALVIDFLRRCQTLVGSSDLPDRTLLLDDAEYYGLQGLISVIQKEE